MILQQTRIQYALPRIERFFKAFPDLASLAFAKEEDVLFAFKGLGYYNRARNLHKGARFVFEKYKGAFPQDHDEILSIPSVGIYTAAAISSICFAEKKAAIDGNVKRIIARYLLINEKMSNHNFLKMIREFVNQKLQESQLHPGLFNEALMELGQKLCVRQNPHCTECPLKQDCSAFKHQLQNYTPARKKPSKKKEVYWLNFLLTLDHKFLLQRDTLSYFLKGQWILPSLLWFPQDDRFVFLIHQKLEVSLRKYLKTFGEEFFKRGKYIHANYVKHTITDHNIRLYRQKIAIDRQVREKDKDIMLCSEERLFKVFVSNAMLKVLKAK